MSRWSVASGDGQLAPRTTATVIHETSNRENFTMNPTIDRRSFLFGASVAGFGIFANGRHGWAGGVGPNEVLNIACIGVGGKGQSDTQHASHHGKIVAVCDIDERRGGQNFERFKDAKRYYDYRKLLDEMGSKIDAVVVSHARPHSCRRGRAWPCGWASTSTARSR